MIKKVIKKLGKSAVVFCCGFALIACEKDDIAEVGKQAPEIATFDLQGNKAELANWRGKTVLLSFWSETCGVCLAELKELETWHSQAASDVKLIAINVDGEKADTQKTVEKRQINQLVLKDQLKITAERYQVIGTPTSFVIDPSGKILYKFEGLIPKDKLDELFKG